MVSTYLRISEYGFTHLSQMTSSSPFKYFDIQAPTWGWSFLRNTAAFCAWFVGRKKRMRTTWGDSALGADIPLSVLEHVLVQAYAAERGIWLSVQRTLGGANGHRNDCPWKKGKVCKKEEKRGDCWASPAPIAQSSWPLVMWSTSYPHQHMDLPTITKGAQNHKHGPFHSSNTANTVFVSYSMSWVSSVCYFLILLLKVW